MLTTLRLLSSDLRHKASWYYDRDDPAAVAKALVTDGTAAMVIHRLMRKQRGGTGCRLWR